MESQIGKLTTAQLTQILKVRQRIDELNNEIAKLESGQKKIIKGHKLVKSIRKRRRKVRMRVQVRTRVKGKGKMTQRALIAEILTKAGKPLSAAEIYKGLVARKHPLKSKNPLKALRVRLYTDKLFSKAKRGYFTLRKTSGKGKRGA